VVCAPASRGSSWGPDGRAYDEDLTAKESTLLFLLFHLDEDCYALAAAQIAEVLPLLDVKRIPRTPPAIAGAIAYRGRTVPVIDLCQLALGRPARSRLSTRTVLVRQAGVGRTDNLLGLIAERATRTFRADAAAFHASGVNNAEARYLGPVARGPAGLIQRVEIDELLTPAMRALLLDPALELPCP
jgi:chemotaxis-related protein WspB